MADSSGGTTRSAFRHSLLASGLITTSQIDEAEHRILTQPGPPAPIVEVTDAMLAQMLIEMELLTQYQADQLRAGRTKLNLGPYIVTDFIGGGGMGHVFRATHEVMGRICAVKVLPLEKSTPEAIEGFRREIRTQAGLDHAHLVRAYDAGKDGKIYFLVTEYVPGSDLRRLVRSNGPLSIQQASSIIAQAARGLHYAHTQGLIHRDVKPGNILVAPDGLAKVSDLGLSGFLHEASQDPRAHKIVGTPDYLSPEQIRTPREVTPVSDIYSLGCTLYYAVTGKVPFPGGTTADKARRHLEETPWHPRKFNPEISEEFVEIIADMMEKDPADRVQTAAEVADRLDNWATEASPIVAQQMSRSSWLAPPLPGSEVDIDVQDDQDTDVGLDDLDQDRQPSEAGSSQISQGTDALASGNQETRGFPTLDRRPPSIHPIAPILERTPPPANPTPRVVMLTLAISVPLSLLAGALLTKLLEYLLG